MNLERVAEVADRIHDVDPNKCVYSTTPDSTPTDGYSNKRLHTETNMELLTIQYQDMSSQNFPRPRADFRERSKSPCKNRI